MLLRNLKLPGEDVEKDIRIEEDRITGITLSGRYAIDQGPPGGQGGMKGPAIREEPPAGSQPVLSFGGDALVFPGLINSHDHLDFNLFPMLGNRIYNDYTEWGEDIHLRDQARISPILKVPQLLRTRWGIYKNLLNGFTTVVNHGERLETGTEELITIFQDCRCLHSLSAEKRWKWAVNSWWGRRRLIAVHIGEGTNAAASREIDRLRRWNFFRRDIVGIHGVAMEERQASSFKGLVWCPGSNYFLLDRTARIGLLKEKVPILFGTDSTLSAGWNSWDHLRLARKEEAMTDMELMRTVTQTPSAVWGLPYLGKIGVGYQADLVIAKNKIANDKKESLDGFYSVNPEDILLVLHRGAVRLFDPLVLEPLREAGVLKATFSKIIIGGQQKYVQGDLPGLMKDIRQYYPEAFFPVVAESD